MVEVDEKRLTVLEAVYNAAVAWEKQYEKSKLSAQQGSIDEGIAEIKKLKDARDLFWAAIRAVGGENVQTNH